MTFCKASKSFTTKMFRRLRTSYGYLIMATESWLKWCLRSLIASKTIAFDRLSHLMWFCKIIWREEHDVVTFRKVSSIWSLKYTHTQNSILSAWSIRTILIFWTFCEKNGSTRIHLATCSHRWQERSTWRYRRPLLLTAKTRVLMHKFCLTSSRISSARYSST